MVADRHDRDMAAKDILGVRGEAIAARYLERLGFTIVERNWRCRFGELDLIARRRDLTIFVEVKTRTSRAFGGPLEAITRIKAARLRRLVGQWCAETALPCGRIRIDVVGIVLPAAGEPVLEHVEAAC